MFNPPPWNQIRATNYFSALSIVHLWLDILKVHYCIARIVDPVGRSIAHSVDSRQPDAIGAFLCPRRL